MTLSLHKKRPTVRTLYLLKAKTRFGEFCLEGSDRAVTRVFFPGRHARKPPAGCRILRAGFPRHLIAARDSLLRYFQARPVSILKLKLDLSGYSPFARRVLKTLAGIPAGSVVTYGGLARRAGCPGAARAVGSVMRKNRLPIFLPCHRVVPSQGGPGGFAGGIAWKKRLLAIESKMKSR